MKVVALVSGGKDSCFNMMQCIRYGHEIVALANLRPPVTTTYDEMDSYMYQTVGYQMVGAIAESMGLPFFQRAINGSPKSQDLSYEVTEKDEVEDLFLLLQEVKDSMPEIGAVSCGAILSNYQRLRVENVCSRLGLVSLAYLWHQDQFDLLQSMISDSYNINAILVKVASFGLSPERHLGKSIKELFPELVRVSRKHQLNICGEGGEYESFVLDCPLFKKRIVIDEAETIIHSNDAFATVAFLKVLKWHLADKTALDPLTFEVLQQENISNIQLQPQTQVNHPTVSWNATDGVVTPTTGASVSLRRVGDFVYISGISRHDSKGSDQQLGEILQLAKEELVKNELGMGCLSFLNVYANNMEDFGKINLEYYKHFGVNPPSRACVQPYKVAGEQWIAIECFGSTLPRSVLHVQSISRWAPACIGPYSQAVTVNPTIFLAGQIGLDPPNMIIMKGGYEAEIKQVLFNLQQVLLEVASNIALCTTISVFVVDSEWIPTVSAILNQYLVDKKEESNLDSEISPIVTFIQLAALPRKALVEVVVTSLASSCNLDIYQSLPCSAPISDRQGVQSHTKGLLCTPREKGCLSLIQVKFGVTTPEMDPIVFANSVARYLQDTIHSHVLDHSILAMRIYHAPQLVHVHAVETVLTKAFGPVTVIPVLYIHPGEDNATPSLICVELIW